MPWARDNLSVLIDKTLADIAARLGGANPYLRRSVLNVLGRVLAGQFNDQLGYLDWQARMAVPVTSRGEYLYAWGALKGVYPKPAAAATGSASVAGAIPGSAVSIGVELRRQDGQLYRVTTGATADSLGNATLPLTAETAGELGNLSAGAPLTFVSTPSGYPSSATLITMTGGADVESDDAFLSRMLQVYRAPPQGGDLADYQRWALEVPGVTRAWAGGYQVMAAGTVTVFFMMDDGAHTNGVPTGTNGVSQYESRDVHATGNQLTVADHIYPLRPVTALVYGAAPVAVPLNLTLAEVPENTTIQAGIAAALNGFLLREASPGGVTLPDNTAGGTVFLSHLNDAISAVPDLDHFVLLSPTSDVTVAVGRISVPGSITYI